MSALASPPTAVPESIQLTEKSPSTDDPMYEVIQDATALRKKAWGKEWKREKKKLQRPEIRGDHGAPDAMQVDGVEPDDGDELEYEVMQEMGWVAEVLQAPRALRADVVILKEYKTLLTALTDSKGLLGQTTQSVVVTGHPGIGKTTFLLFLLLSLLQKEQPTALQLNSNHYLIFDEEGVDAKRLDVYNNRVRRCWTLVDSNDQVGSPCGALLSNAQRIIQTTPPKIDRWKNWSTQHEAELYIMDLPDVMEVGAIAKEHKYNDPSTLTLTLTYVNKWGPCTRMVLKIMKKIRYGGNVDDLEDSLHANAENGASTIISSPSLLRAFSLEIDNRPAGPVDGVGSGLLFVRPGRRPLPDGTFEVKHASSIPIIPTQYLFDIFVQQLRLIDRQNSLQFFRVFNSHSHLRSSAGWVFEALVHARLGSDGPELPLRTFWDETETPTMMQPSTNVIPGTLNSLGGVAKNEAFYWRPTGTTFPGIDAILGTADGSLYAIQVTISHSHCSPVKGLKQVWEHIRGRVNAHRDLHVVVVTNEDAVAQRLVAQFKTYLKDEKFGQKNIQPVVWGCVLPLI